jgi:hypothetical protein
MTSPHEVLNQLSPAFDRERSLLESLRSLLDQAALSLNDGEALSLMATSQQIHAAAGELSVLSLHLARLPLSPERQRERRHLLTEIAQRSAFCRAVLRRWRRSLALRQQLLQLRTGQPFLYTDSLRAAQELP